MIISLYAVNCFSSFKSFYSHYKYFGDYFSDMHNLTFISICQGFILCLEVRELHSLLIYIYILLYSHLHHHSASQRHNIKDRRMIKTQEGRHKKTSLEKYSPLTLLQGFKRLACERMLETEHKLHILTPLLWPSRCVFLVLLDAQPEVLGSIPSGLFRGPPRSGVVFPTTFGL